MDSYNDDRLHEHVTSFTGLRDWLPLDLKLCERLCNDSPPRSYSYWTQFGEDLRSFAILEHLVPLLALGAFFAYKESWQIGLGVVGLVIARYLFKLNRAVSAMRHDTVEYGAIAGNGDPTPYPKRPLIDVLRIRGMTADLSNGASVLVVLSKGPLTELLDGGRSAEVLVRYTSKRQLNSVIAYRPFPDNGLGSPTH